MVGMHSGKCLVSICAGPHGRSVGGNARLRQGPLAQRDVGDELVAAPGHGDDEAMFIRTLAQRAPQLVDRLRQAPFLDDDVRPDRLQQRRLVDQLTGVLDQIQERVEHARRERYRLPIFRAQQALRRIELEVAELVYRRRSLFVHRIPEIRENA